MKNNFVKLGVMLCIVAALAAGVLAFTNEATKERIRVAEELASSGPDVAAAVIPGAVSFELYEDEALVDKIKAENDKFVELRVCKDASGNVLGYGIRVFSSDNGYGGNFEEMFLGVSEEGEMLGMKVVSHDETAGLGTKAFEPAFQDQFIGRNTDIEIKVVKNNPKDDEIQAVSGATRSSASITSAINNAMSVFNKYLKK